MYSTIGAKQFHSGITLTAKDEKWAVDVYKQDSEVEKGVCAILRWGEVWGVKAAIQLFTIKKFFCFSFLRRDIYCQFRQFSGKLIPTCWCKYHLDPTVLCRKTICCYLFIFFLGGGGDPVCCVHLQLCVNFRDALSFSLCIGARFTAKDHAVTSVSEEVVSWWFANWSL